VSAEIWPDVVDLIDERYDHYRVPLERIVDIGIHGVTIKPDPEQELPFRVWSADGTEVYTIPPKP
jgi:hypothetical protein